jgi:hypothetical protein
VEFYFIYEFYIVAVLHFDFNSEIAIYSVYFYILDSNIIIY